ncbi:N(6)-adenine-specific methyltransferase METTL4 isoform X2 [Lutzomyia longipalpis]|uniref:N(6)-adenine-specific methyltransferase METTL4 isoform X2 n=1 Tax=Lutzomyia longipalpis TaxID=7200 RepID=UPI0024837222|nr:N(6)-adenine-specific methyltransferase METTL4 isoform X2 [Lutzomyia longipalpis]
MAVVFRCENCLFLSHKELIDSHYRGVYEIKPEFFEINQPYAQRCDSPNQKRKRRKLCKQEENAELEEKLRDFVGKCRETGYFGGNPGMTNEEAVVEAARVHNHSISHPVLQGENKNLQCICTKVDEEEFIIPPNCRFYQNDVRQIEKFLPSGEEFDLIVIDPPWWNKYIRRVKRANRNISYDMLYNDDVAAIPIGGLTSGRCIVAIWCTNNKSHLEDIASKFIPRWGLKYVTQWLWMKVTKAGEPICSFAGEEKKQPYERIIVAVKDTALEERIPKDLILFSVPSSIHSHKPPLLDVFKPYLPEEPKCLEIFARYLHPGFTSIGLEVLKLQHK